MDLNSPGLSEIASVEFDVASPAVDKRSGACEEPSGTTLSSTTEEGEEVSTEEVVVEVPLGVS